MKFSSSAACIALPLLQRVVAAEELECKSEGVTNKATCDTWCGSTGAFLSSTAGNESGHKGLEGWSCDCAAVTGAETTKKCTATFDYEEDAQDCTGEGVKDKKTCDTYCREVGYYTGSYLDGTLFKIECMCGPGTNEYEKHCISDISGSAASNMNLGAVGVVGGLIFGMAALI